MKGDDSWSHGWLDTGKKGDDSWMVDNSSRGDDSWRNSSVMSCEEGDDSSRSPTCFLWLEKLHSSF